jgi:transposase-like protein
MAKEPVSVPAAKRANSISDFCRQHGISRGLYYKIRRKGKGPREGHVGKRVIISDEASADWRRDIELIDD